MCHAFDPMCVRHKHTPSNIGTKKSGVGLRLRACKASGKYQGEVEGLGPSLQHRAKRPTAPVCSAVPLESSRNSADAPLRLTPREKVSFLCPSCGGTLVSSEAASHLKCDSGHVIDVAKEGHVHLLPPVRKSKAGASTDVDDIVRASRLFFEHGGFDEQINGVAQEVVRAVCDFPRKKGERPQVLFAGCGEGVYMRRTQKLLEAAEVRRVQLWGTDASKLAVRYAARRQPLARFAVASSHRLPFADGSFDVVCASFSPSSWDEFCRVLRPGGAVITARAGFEHLLQLRHAAGAADTAPRPPKEFSSGLAENYLRFRTEKVIFSGEVKAGLLGMSPFVRNAQDDVRQHLYNMSEIVCSVDVICTTHRVWLGTARGRFEM